MYTQDSNEPTISAAVNEPPNPTQPTLLIATVNEARRRFLAFQLDADGYTVHEADHLAAVVAKLSVHAIDVLVLGDLEHPADSPTLLPAIRAGQRPRIHPGQAVITVGPGDELTALRAYGGGRIRTCEGRATRFTAAPV